MLLLLHCTHTLTHRRTHTHAYQHTPHSYTACIIWHVRHDIQTQTNQTSLYTCNIQHIQEDSTKKNNEAPPSLFTRIKENFVHGFLAAKSIGANSITSIVAVTYVYLHFSLLRFISSSFFVYSWSIDFMMASRIVYYLIVSCIKKFFGLPRYFCGKKREKTFENNR